ncbi:MAG: TraR/DksA family transcriptional regulator [Nitrospirota bacterium]|nr:TraR/DksA family transcriptional regulator [Nitrospirota bacterium]MDH5585150.1 TraR/DksA family transcriptional regulator [Nitrospirota bacterium]MDH5773372.1 TraR/DksA family transcriptional regulator [Nitrospirota bacterium]
MLDHLDHQHFKHALLALQSDILAVEQSGQEATHTVELDQTTIGRVSRMDALQGQAIAKDSQQRRMIQLQRIDASLQRLKKGIFGLCLRCGEDIHRKRLEFDPTAPLCIDCARHGKKG